MGSKNGKGETVEQVMEHLKDVPEQAGRAVRDADVIEKVDRLLDFVEENAALIAALGKRFTGEAAREAGATIGEAAESVGDAATTALEVIAEEVIKPTVKYGRGLRHGILLGAAVAILYTPWPGAIARAKLKALVDEAKEMVNTFRAGAADTAA